MRHLGEEGKLVHTSNRTAVAVNPSSETKPCGFLGAHLQHVHEGAEGEPEDVPLPWNGVRAEQLQPPYD